MKGLRSVFIKVLFAIICLLLLAACANSGVSPLSSVPPSEASAPASPPDLSGPGLTVDQKVEKLLAAMTLDEKVGQMIQPSREVAGPDEVAKYFLGSVLSGGGSFPGGNSKEDWIGMCTAYQDAAKSTRLGIPVIYGIDAVHGHNTVYGAVVFPQNIGLGAANDPQLMKEIGAVTASEMLTSGVNWNFGPCIAVCRDERWGRSYESYSERPDIVSRLCVPYIQALQQDQKITACAKHYVGDGGTTFGTGDRGYLIDQGDTQLSEADLRGIHLPGYEAAVKAGVKTVMASFSSWNGVNMHQNKYLIQEVLKDELGFKGFVVSDWEGLHHIAANSFSKCIVLCINAGVDMLMEPSTELSAYSKGAVYHWKTAIGLIKDAVKKGQISQARLDDAVGRILRVKFEMGLFENPLGDRSLAAKDFGEEKNRQVAQKAVRESLVLLKNKNAVLPLKKNAKIFVTGPACNDVGAQCGGWTRSWQGGLDEKGDKWMKGTTILEGLQGIAKANGGVVITDPAQAKKADVAVVVVGEGPYAEGPGDDATLDLYSGMALPGNREALAQAKDSGLPVVAILVSGRPRIVTEEIKDWDAFVAAWLPGTEGAAVADVLYGDYDFTGKLSFTWPQSVDQLPLNVDDMGGKTPLFPFGFGLKMKQ